MIAQDSPTQTWITGWVDWLGTYLSWIFLIVAFGFGLLILVRAARVVHARVRVRDGGDLVHQSHWIARVPGGVRGAIAFGIVAALVFFVLTRTEEIATFFGRELPIDDE